MINDKRFKIARCHSEVRSTYLISSYDRSAQCTDRHAAGLDLIAAEGYDLRDVPLVARKAILQTILPPAGPFRFVEHFEKEGEALYAQVERMGLEGIMAKKADSPYRMRRSANWVKIRADRVDDFVVVGASRPKGSRAS